MLNRSVVRRPWLAEDTGERRRGAVLRPAAFLNDQPFRGERHAICKEAIR
jgi:hypothetical protein